MQKFDNLIVGGGLAGVWTAFRLLQKNKSFVLIDQIENNTSSRVAAGIYNPLLAKRQKVSYNAAQLYPHLAHSYHELELLLHKKFCHKHSVAYLIENLKELNDWAALAESDWFGNYVQLKNERIADQIISDFGYVEILHSGWVDIPLFLDSFYQFIPKPNIFLNQFFDSNQLIPDDFGFTYQGYYFEHAIFCQGTGISDNPLTSHIRLKPAKGEVLTIQSDVSFSEIIPQNGVFVLPISSNEYKVGSNFSWSELNHLPTEAAKNEILQKLQKWFKAPFEIVSHVAGVRPSALDRRPIVGQLNVHPKAFILNGFGSKGVSHAPYYSDMLVKFMYDGVKIDKEVDVNRFI